jgi:hypothetical protein
LRTDSACLQEQAGHMGGAQDYRMRGGQGAPMAGGSCLTLPSLSQKYNRLGEGWRAWPSAQKA